MKKINKNGFILAESLLVSTFVLTVLVFLFIQFKNLLIVYNESYTYNTAQNLYMANNLAVFLNETGYIEVENALENSSDNYVDLSLGSENITNYLNETAVWNNLITKSNIKVVLFTFYDLKNLKTTINSTNYDQKLKNYILKLKTSGSYGYRLIVEYNDGTFGTIKIKSQVTSPDINRTFAYTGGSQTYNVNKTGYYKIELWGAQGGTQDIYNHTSNGGKGSYTSGVIFLNQNEVLQVYVGEAGATINEPGALVGFANTSSSAVIPATFNGGGSGIDESDGTTLSGNDTGTSGGGATDIRLIGGSWNNANSLNSRIMVAAGGSGAYNSNGTAYAGGPGGNLLSTHNNAFNSASATQTSGNAFGVGRNGVFNTSSGDWGSTGGGGGYWGGSNTTVSVSSGGSSYISGYAGVNSITSASSTTASNKTKHYLNKYFFNAEMKAGSELMPTQEGNGTMTGNSGNGYAKITYLGSTVNNKDSSKIKNVQYILDCTQQNSANSGNHWIEIEAISEGENVARGKTVTGQTPTGTVASLSNPSYAVDGIIDNSSYYADGGSSQKCLKVNLGREYNLEEIAIWHWFVDGRSYYNNTTKVAGSNEVYRILRNNISNTVETPNGIRIREDVQ